MEAPAEAVFLDGRGMTALPDSLRRNNALAEAPAALARLGRLRVLDLRGNRLDDLPHALGDLPALEKLDLRWNRFARLPGAAARLAGRGAVVLS
jgi:Leucine-rich repeat (LRR) protein